MNNSQLAQEAIGLTLETKVDRSEELRVKETRLVRILEAIREIQESSAWSSLKVEVWDELPKKLKRDILHEARSQTRSTTKLDQLSGELRWAEKYSDLSKLENQFRVELQGVRTLLHGNNSNS